MVDKRVIIAAATVVVGAGVYGAATLREQFKEKVQPKRGSVLKVDLAGVLEHSGIYLGSGLIAELNGRGEVKAVGFEEFTNNLTGITVYCAVNQGGEPLYREEWYQRAHDHLGMNYKYRLIPRGAHGQKNCHNFVASCIKGNFWTNTTCFFTGLELLLKGYDFAGWQPCWRKYRDA